MEEFEMTQTELILFLETLAENVELKAKTGEDAAGIIRKKIEVLKKETPTPGKQEGFQSVIRVRRFLPPPSLTLLL